MSRRFTFVTSPSGEDEALLAYWAAAGITDQTEKDAQSVFVSGLKSAGLFDKFYYIHFMSPTSLVAAQFDMLGNHNITWFNSPTHSTLGVKGNAISAAGVLNFNAGVDALGNDFSIGFFANEAGFNTGYDHAAQNTGNIHMSFYNSSALYIGFNGINAFEAKAAGELGFLCCSSNGVTSYVYLNDVEEKSGAYGEQMPEDDMGIFCKNTPATRKNFTSSRWTFAYASTYLTALEISTLDGLVQTLNENIIAGGRDWT